VPGNGRAGFGERPGETGPEQSRQRASGRLNRGKDPAPVERTGKKPGILKTVAVTRVV
jgi:hypothetical protein